jgi:hypothetical protein
MLLKSPQNREFAGPLVLPNVRMTHVVTLLRRSTAASVSEEFYSTHWLHDVRVGCDGVDRKRAAESSSSSFSLGGDRDE